MKAFVAVVSTLFALANAKPGLLGGLPLGLGPIGTIGGPIGPIAGPIGGPIVGGPIGPYGLGLGLGLGAGPILAPAPVIVQKPVIPTLANQYQIQDTLGNTNFGYSNINSAQQESSSPYGGKVGSYSYVDPNGELQTVSYVADANGFRVTSATNLPVAPAVPDVPALEPPVDTGMPPVDTGVAPEPVMDTPEVAAAKAEHLAAVEEAKNRNRRSVLAGPGLIGSPLLGSPLIGSPLIGAGPLGAPLIGSPLIASAPLAIAKPVGISGYSSTTINPVSAGPAVATLAGPLPWPTAGLPLAAGLGW